MYTDNSKKMAVVLNRRHPAGLLLNAFGHLVLGLAADLGPLRCELLDYVNERTPLHARISTYPVIVLGAKNANQIRSTYEQACGSDVETNVFVTAMLGASATQQMSQTAEAEPDELEFVGLAMFGRSESLHPLTKRFSLLTSLT